MIRIRYYVQDKPQKLASKMCLRNDTTMHSVAEQLEMSVAWKALIKMSASRELSLAQAYLKAGLETDCTQIPET